MPLLLIVVATVGMMREFRTTRRIGGSQSATQPNACTAARRAVPRSPRLGEKHADVVRENLRDAAAIGAPEPWQCYRGGR